MHFREHRAEAKARILAPPSSQLANLREPFSRLPQSRVTQNPSFHNFLSHVATCILTHTSLGSVSATCLRFFVGPYHSCNYPDNNHSLNVEAVNWPCLICCKVGEGTYKYGVYHTLCKGHVIWLCIVRTSEFSTSQYQGNTSNYSFRCRSSSCIRSQVRPSMHAPSHFSIYATSHCCRVWQVGRHCCLILSICFHCTKCFVRS